MKSVVVHGLLVAGVVAIVGIGQVRADPETSGADASVTTDTSGQHVESVLAIPDPIWGLPDPIWG